jgi:hypothetical protein
MLPNGAQFVDEKGKRRVIENSWAAFVRNVMLLL